MQRIDGSGWIEMSEWTKLLNEAVQAEAEGEEQVAERLLHLAIAEQQNRSLK
jgi:hypothetical protein